MKLFLRNGLMVCGLAILLPHAASSQDTAPARLYVPAGNDSVKMSLSADSIVREDPPNPGPSPFASVVRLRGHVEVRSCCVQYPPSKEFPDPPRAYMILHADEADVQEQTGEIEAHGVVRVTFQPQQAAR
jgi:hypothetical protein